MRHLWWGLILTASFSVVSGQGQGKYRDFYFSWGYTRAWYSKSTLHFVNHSNQYNPVTGRYDQYDFTLYDAKAEDRPDFDQLKDVVNITIPQYAFRIGFSAGKKWMFELNYDHTKYILRDYQRVRIKGEFNDIWVDQDTVIDPVHFLHFEHSDGANFWMLNAVRRVELLKLRQKHRLCLLIKPGAGVVIPRTDVTLFGQRLNNDWKLAGYIVGLECGLRADFYKNCFLELVSKGSYANYINAFVLGKGHGKASHSFFAGQVTATAGLRFGSF